MSRPVQYQNGTVEFFGHIFTTDSRALIPRFETEFLVSTVLARCSKDPRQSRSIVDVGTGSGVIAISLALEMSAVRITAIDRSPMAMALARENALRHDVGDRIRFVQGDLLAGFAGEADVIVANLPYIPTGRIPLLDPSVRDFEPHEALDGGHDGLELYRRLFEQIAVRAAKPELCVFEFDEGQERIMRKELSKHLPDMKIEILKDASDLHRYIILTI